MINHSKGRLLAGCDKAIRDRQVAETAAIGSDQRPQGLPNSLVRLWASEPNMPFVGIIAALSTFYQPSTDENSWWARSYKGI
jgi:hypothetical protein